MYENVTFESIMERILSRVPSTMDKREGSVIYDAIAPAAIELQNVYIELDTVLNETFADTASLYYLKKRAAERGISQILATNAILQGEFTPSTLTLDIGARFSCDTLNYIITEKISDGVYKLKCETVGTEGNVHLGTLIPIDYIAGLETAELTEVLIPAIDDETVEHLRERYFDSITSQAFGGNVADYKEKVTTLPNIPISGVKVTPVWNGGGTVKLTITDGNFDVPSEELIAAVQNEIDPVGHQGQGVGLAPIGHVVTVVGVRSKIINIVTNITYQEGWNWESAKIYIQNAIDKYFHELSKTWDENENLIVRVSQLESRILTSEGVLDVSGTTLNGSDANLSLETDEIPIRGTVNGNE
jgi:uncharacterized phage protein gp47/JayE